MSSVLNSFPDLTGRERGKKITEAILGAAIQVHRKLGPGLRESARKAGPVYELKKRGLAVEQEKAAPLVYEEVKLECGCRLDMRVERCAVVERKAVEAPAPVHQAQARSHRKLSGCKLALLVNFNVAAMKDGLRR